MALRKTIVLTAIGAAGLVGILIAVLAYREFFGVPMQFSAHLYATAPTSAKGTFSYDDYAAVLKEYVDDRDMVDYAALKENRRRLDQFARALASVNPKTYEGWDAPAKIAFWINAYNALTLEAIIDHYPIQAGTLRSLAFPKNSIRQIPGVWDKLQFLVMGKKMTLEHIEHQVLRKEFDEPRIHVALVCAAMGCPPLRNEPYVGPRLTKQLDDQARKFLSDPAKFRIDRNGGKVYLSSIFEWFGGDFVAKYKPESGYAGHSDAQRAVLHFASGHLPPADAKYLRDGRYSVAYLDYDWSLNEQGTAAGR
ncbi:MAG: DUF547 domain-containing protein [Phycisphaerae bacterium]|nr:DUF547 domain-containing protein [Phycisphaerae bacterium]